MRKKCKHCGLVVATAHDCSKAGRTIPAPSSSNDSGGDFLTSMAVGMLTDNAIIGAAVGGSIAGGIVGDSLGGDGGFFG